MSQLPPEVYNLIDDALSEDQAFNDPTTQALVPDGVHAVGMHSIGLSVPFVVTPSRSW